MPIASLLLTDVLFAGGSLSPHSLSPALQRPACLSTTSQQVGSSQAQHSGEPVCLQSGQETRRKHKPGVVLYRHPTHTPLSGSWAQEGSGRGLERGPAVRPPQLPNPRPTLPLPRSTPQCPRGLRHRHTESRGTVPLRGGTKGWRDEQGPTGREMPGRRAAGRQQLETAAGEPGHDWPDARCSVPLSIQGGFSPGSSEAGRALLKSFLCVSVC